MQQNFKKNCAHFFCKEKEHFFCIFLQRNAKKFLKRQGMKQHKPRALQEPTYLYWLETVDGGSGFKPKAGVPDAGSGMKLVSGCLKASGRKT